MKTAVIGAGAIGALAAGYLKDKGRDVVLIAHPAAQEAINKNGLKISGARGDFSININAALSLNSAVDLAILAVKTQDVEAAIKENLGFLRQAIVLTAQNGVQADNLLSLYIPREKIITSIVMFGATSLEPGKVVHNFEGGWILGRAFGKNDADVERVSALLGEAFKVSVADDIWGEKYLKIFVNANNCIPAILGVSMQEAFSDIETAKISIAIWKEGLDVINKAGIKLVSLPDFPLERLTKLTAMPTPEAAGIFMVIMKNLSNAPLYGSILQSIKRGKSSEIDYINGEFVNLAVKFSARAPLNEKLTQMVHQVEQTHKFFTKEEMQSSVKKVIQLE
ncbi:MAG: 2-dehydropantoate 2-reductase [Candidatus Omnitrophota bacterium]|nr:2-dehydropantoate 2-reductase [Candidatus Omnitrophota bacterium]